MVVEKKVCKKFNTEKDATYYDTNPDAPIFTIFVVRSSFGSSRISKLLVVLGIRQMVEFAYRCEACYSVTAKCPHCDGYNLYCYEEKQKCETCNKVYYNFCS